MENAKKTDDLADLREKATAEQRAAVAAVNPADPRHEINLLRVATGQASVEDVIAELTQQVP